MKTITLATTLMLIALVETGCDTTTSLDYTPSAVNSQSITAPVLANGSITDSATYASPNETVQVTNSPGGTRTWVNATPGSQGHWSYR